MGKQAEGCYWNWDSNVGVYTNLRFSSVAGEDVSRFRPLGLAARVPPWSYHKKGVSFPP